MKKKILSLALTGALVLSIAACTTSNTTTATSEPAPVAEVTSVEVKPAEASETVVEEQPAAPDFTGTWAEELSGRGYITFTPAGENTYNVEVHWGSSAFESANWNMTATYYDSTGLCEYSDCTYYIRTYTDEENYTDETVYTDGAGYFYFEDGKLCWGSAESDKDGIDGSSYFINADEPLNE